MNEKPLAAWQRRDNFSIGRHQEVVDRLNQRAQGATTGQTILATPFGQTTIDPSDSRTWIPCKVQLTDNDDGGGVGFYKGFICRSAAVGDGAVDLTEPLGQTTASAPDCLIANTLEDSAFGAGGIGSFPCYAVGMITGKSIDGRYLVEITVGGGIPAPTQRYQVYTPIDDTLNPIWTYARFM